MKELVVISGKGGTGKTSITASFASLAGNAVIADCDVDAADLHLILQPKVIWREDFSGGRKARIVAGKCTGCGKCSQVCRFEAVISGSNGNRPRVDEIACEGCGVCTRFCPEGAIEFEPAVNGEWFSSKTRYGPMVHAKLGVAEENSGKLVTLVRNEARAVAERMNRELVIIDGSPGIGCPVIASVTGADLALVVTEPTLSGLHDLGRIAGVTAHFNVPTVVCINKCDINEELSARIENEATGLGVKVIGRVRYDPAVTKAQIMGASVVEYSGGLAAQQVKSLWRNVSYYLD